MEKSLLAVREMMHHFYIQLKNNEVGIRFLMLTGVTKLTKVSVLLGGDGGRDAGDGADRGGGEDAGRLRGLHRADASKRELRR